MTTASLTRRRTSRRDFEAFIAAELAKIEAAPDYDDASLARSYVFGAAMLASHQRLIGFDRWKEISDEASRLVGVVLDRQHGRKAA